MAEKVYCLYRVSTTKQVDIDEQKQADIPMQRKACREFAERMGWTIIREEQENGVSGFSVSASDRDKLQFIKEHAEQGRFDILLVFMFDRIGRRAEETPFVVEWLVQHGIRVWSVNEGEQRFDNHTDYLLNYIRYWQASGESKKTSLRTKTALGQMVKEGRFRGGTVPYGYRLEKSGKFNKRNKEINQLMIDEAEAQIVQKIFDLCITYGYGRSRIAGYLNEHGLKNRQGGIWCEASIGAILHNIQYMGILRSGDSISEPFEALRIISSEMFEKAQTIMKMRLTGNQSIRTIPQNTKGQSLLSGNIFCGHCSGRLVLTTNGKVVSLTNGGTKGVKRIRYICFNKTRKHMECDGQTGYTMHIVDKAVEEAVISVLNKIATAADNKTIINIPQKEQIKELQSKLNAAEANRAKAMTEYSAVKRKVEEVIKENAKFPNALLDTLVEEACKTLAEAEEECSTLKCELADALKHSAEITKMYESVRIWARIFDICSCEAKKMILASAIQRIELSREYQIKIIYSEQIQLLLKALHLTVDRQIS